MYRPPRPTSCAPITVVAALLVLALAGAGSAVAETYNVNLRVDVYTGGCSSLMCSLRDALILANANPGSDVIKLGTGIYQLDLTGSDDDLGLSGDLDVTDPVEISGQGQDVTIIDGSALSDRVLHVIDPGGIVTLKRLGIRGGQIDACGGGILIKSGGLVLDQVTVSENDSGTEYGGGICAEGSPTVTVENGSEITGNSSSGGGGIYTHGSVTLNVISSTIAGNSAGSGTGGGLYTSGLTISLSGSTISGNTAVTGGGLTAGGGANVNAVNCTISGNVAVNNSGGIRTLSPATVTLTNVTVAANVAVGYTAIHNTDTINLANSLIEGSCGGTALPFSSGGNVESGTTCGLGGDYDLGNVGDLLLQPLGDYGGPTLTHTPRSGSPALGASIAAFCPAVDQRGFARDVGDCDVGAVEQQPADINIFTDDFELGNTTAWSSTAP